MSSDEATTITRAQAIVNGASAVRLFMRFQHYDEVYPQTNCAKICI